MKKSILVFFILIFSFIIQGKSLEEFSIYLPKTNIPIMKIGKLQKERKIHKLKIMDIELEEKPFIACDDIISYCVFDHRIHLKKDSYIKFSKLPIYQMFFVCIGDNPIYWGIIWSDGISAPFTGTIVRKPSELMEKETIEEGLLFIKIECGYPTEGYFQGKDLRGDKRIIEALRKAGKLIE